MGINVMNEIGFALEVAAEQAPPRRSGASRDQIKRLITPQLLDEQDIREGFHVGISGECFRLMDSPSESDGNPEQLLNRAIAPSAKLIGLRQAKRYSAAAEAAEQPNYAVAKSSSCRHRRKQRPLAWRNWRIC